MRYRLLLILFFSLIQPAQALEIPAPTHDYVNDWAGMMSPSMKGTLETRLEQFDQQTSNQILIITLPSLEGDALEDFSIRLAQVWKPGTAEKDNGLILLVFKNDRALRIEVGHGLEGVVPDVRASQIIRNVITPRFKEMNYDQGFSDGIDAIISSIDGNYQDSTTENTSHTYSNSLSSREQRHIFTALAIISLFLIIIDSLRYFFYTSRQAQYRYSAWEWWFRFSLFLWALQTLFRILFFILSNSGGGRGGGRSGGGFSGGGGSFGGGGASGRW